MNTANTDNLSYPSVIVNFQWRKLDKERFKKRKKKKTKKTACFCFNRSPPFLRKLVEVLPKKDLLYVFY